MTYLAREDGMTLADLLVTIGIIGILAAIAIQEFGVYRQRVNYVLSEETLRDARTALEGSNIDEANGAGGMQVAWLNKPGKPPTAAARRLLPGYVVPQRSDILVLKNPTCGNAMCLKEYIRARNCNADKYLYWYRFGNGIELTVRDVPALWQC